MSLHMNNSETSDRKQGHQASFSYSLVDSLSHTQQTEVTGNLGILSFHDSEFPLSLDRQSMFYV